MKALGQLPIHGFNEPTHAISTFVELKRWSSSHIAAQWGLEQHAPGVVQPDLLLQVDEAFIPKDARIHGDTNQQGLDQVDVMTRE